MSHRKWSWCTGQDSDNASDDIPATLERLEAEGNEVVSIVLTAERNGTHYYRIFYREPTPEVKR